MAVCVAEYFGINPPGFVAQVVAFAFGLAAASFFPAIILGIFSKRANRPGAIIGTLGMMLNFSVALLVSARTAPPPKEIQDLVDSIRKPGDPLLHSNERTIVGRPAA